VLVTTVAVGTGGIGSFAAIWLVVIPLEAALLASRRTVALASSFALCGAGFLLLMGHFGDLPPVVVGKQGAALAALGIISAALYAAGLALGAESLSRMSLRLRHADEDRYRLLARNMTDVIARHARNGAVQFISPAAEPLFGAKAHDLLEHGLFERVHVADRPSYLTALSDAATRRESRSVEFRVRQDANDGEASKFVWVEMRCRTLEPEAGEDDEPGVVAVMRDITERKEQEVALEGARTEAERANAARPLSATVSHELRTPLNAIIGFQMLTNEER
jgi:cell cycle sensor histidine kinase DivJ